MRKKLAVAVAFGTLLTLLLLIPMPRGSRELGAVGDFLHAPTFAIFAALVFRVIHGRRGLGRLSTGALAWGLLAAFGLATEIIQSFVGRNPSWADVGTNMLGAAAGTLWAMSRTGVSRRAHAGLLAMAGLALLMAATRPALTLLDCQLQRLQMPQIASFEQPLEVDRWRTWRCHVRRTRDHATDGFWSLRANFRPGEFQGIGLPGLPPDWSPYEELVFDVTLGKGPPLDLVVKVTDKGNKGTIEDRFERAFPLTPGEHRIRIPLSAIAAGPETREIDLRRILFLQLFTCHLESPRMLFVDNVHLR